MLKEKEYICTFCVEMWFLLLPILVPPKSVGTLQGVMVNEVSLDELGNC